MNDGQPGSYWRSGRWLPIAAFVVVMSVACVLLAQWQIDRLDQRRATNAVVEDAAAQSTVDAFDLDSSGESVQWRAVSATGRYSADEELLVRQRRLSGKNGYFVLTPLEASKGRVWILRGWVPPGPDAATPPEVPDPPAGVVTVRGYARTFETTSGTDPGLPQGQVQRISVDEVLGTGPTADVVDTLWIQATDEEPPSPPQPLRLPPPELSEGPHLGYAIQWGMFALMALVGGAVIVRRQREYYAEDVAAARAALTEDEER